MQDAAEARESGTDIPNGTLYSVEKHCGKTYGLRATLLNEPKSSKNDTISLEKLEQDNRRASRAWEESLSINKRLVLKASSYG